MKKLYRWVFTLLLLPVLLASCEHNDKQGTRKEPSHSPKRTPQTVISSNVCFKTKQVEIQPIAYFGAGGHHYYARKSNGIMFNYIIV